ncbi:carbohydrate ABC transporter permease [Sporofaciens sp. SGI.106]|uniref:carbohydrate ABC transporter permease n=1 Tax=Sporofaciens sp. SGI.106 TaxID=3420568 RepID=UPI003D05372E
MKKISNIIINIFLICVILICTLPFLYMILMSLKSTTNAYDFTLSLSDMTFAHYQKIFSDPTFIRYFFNSVFVALAGVLLTLFTSCTAGYAFAKLKFKGNDLLFFLIILTLLVPSEVILVPLYLVVRGFGWVNTFKALILPLPTAFGVFVMRQAILAVPDELIESAKIDGASNAKILRAVILPLVKSAMLTVAIFTFIGAWNNFTWPLIITTEDAYRTLPLALTAMKTQYDTDVGLTMACAAITFLPPFIFYLFLQSKFEEGMALSGLKG